MYKRQELGGEYYRFDEARQELRGERTGVRYGAGSRLRVQVSRVDLDARKIDFRLVREGATDRLLSRGRRDKTPPAAAVPAVATEALAEVKKQDRELLKASRERKKSSTGGKRGAAAGKGAQRGASGKAGDQGRVRRR